MTVVFHATLLALLWCARTAQVPHPQLPGHDMFFNAFDGTRFAFPVFHKGIFTLLSHADHLINAVFIDRGAGQPLMTGVAVRYKADLQLFAATMASSKHPNVSMTVLVNDKRLETDGTRSLLPVGRECEVLLDRRSSNDERLVIQTPYLTVYVLKYADSPNIDLHVDVEEALVGEVHGILGQTFAWVGAQDSGARTLEGDETRYVASSIFADDAKINVFKWGDTNLGFNL